jgi:hypothetical protein
MMSVWSHRPRLLHLVLFGASYVLGCAFAKALRLAPGTNISVWLPGGLLMATLILTSIRSWPGRVAVGCPGELIGQFSWFRSPLPAALLVGARHLSGLASSRKPSGPAVDRRCHRGLVRMDADVQSTVQLIAFDCVQSSRGDLPLDCPVSLGGFGRRRTSLMERGTFTLPTEVTMAS